jgi:two-component system phosphate regulon sensor histidine kinase PhoR
LIGGGVMKWTKEYIIQAIIYLIVIIYIALFNVPIITILLVLGLLIYHTDRYLTIRKELQQEKDMSVSKLEYRLEKTKQRQTALIDQFNSLSQSFGSGLLLVDEDGIIQYSNVDMNDYFGYDFNSKDYQSLIDFKKLYQFVNEAYLLETSLQSQISYRGRSYDLISTPLFDGDLFKGCLILAHDITTIKHAEQYQKRFTADVSHELRTPLSAIKGFSEIMLRDTDMSPKDREEFIELIHKESERMEVLLRDLSEISKLDRRDYELEIRPTNIKTLVEECLAILSQQIKESSLELIQEIEPVELPIDTDKMSQVIRNIVKNAISYTDEGHIKIKGYTDHNRYKLEISDTGIGIKEEDFDKIFKRFYRVDKARSRDTGGSGLGLSISKNVVKKHGGTISVSSIEMKGTTFTITLPLEE